MAFIRAAKHTRDVSAHFDIITQGDIAHGLEALQRLVNAAVDVLLGKALGRRPEDSHFLHAQGDCLLQPYCGLLSTLFGGHLLHN
jgi:hypothetical protein